MSEHPIPIAHVIDGLGKSRQRHPVTRIGEREPIPAEVRAAVWFRDRGACELCGTREQVRGPWHLDHIKPWSADGPDTTDNLRLLCEAHNLERSNFIDPTEYRPRRPATWWCIHCYSDLIELAWDYHHGAPLACPLHPNPKRCRVMRGIQRARELHGETPTWHQREPVSEQDSLIVAYCAHCDAPALTRYPL